MHEDFDKELAGSVVDTAAIHGLREEMELEFAIHKDMVHTHGSVTGEQNFSCEEVALEVQKSLCLSVCLPI